MKIDKQAIRNGLFGSFSVGTVTVLAFLLIWATAFIAKGFMPDVESLRKVLAVVFFMSVLGFGAGISVYYDED